MVIKRKNLTGQKGQRRNIGGFKFTRNSERERESAPLMSVFLLRGLCDDEADDRRIDWVFCFFGLLGETFYDIRNVTLCRRYQPEKIIT